MTMEKMDANDLAMEIKASLSKAALAEIVGYGIIAFIQRRFNNSSIKVLGSDLQTLTIEINRSGKREIKEIGLPPQLRVK
jgi:hypothetical protein